MKIVIAQSHVEGNCIHSFKKKNTITLANQIISRSYKPRNPDPKPGIIKYDHTLIII